MGTIISKPTLCTSSGALVSSHFTPFCWIQDIERTESRTESEAEIRPRSWSSNWFPLPIESSSWFQGLPASPASVLHGPPHHYPLLSFPCFSSGLKFSVTSLGKLFLSSDKIATFHQHMLPECSVLPVLLITFAQCLIALWSVNPQGEGHTVRFTAILCEELKGCLAHRGMQ